MAVGLVIFAISLIASAYIVSQIPQGKTSDPKALTQSEFGTPQISEGRSKPVLLGTKWITDPTVIDYGDYSTTPVYKEP